VATDGSDTSSCTRDAPCASFDRAYHLARSGMVVEVAAGTYTDVELTPDATKTAGKDVVFQPAPGAQVSFSGRLSLRGVRHVTIRDMTVGRTDADWDLLLQPCNQDITFDNVGGGRWFAITEGNSNITFRGGSWGGYDTPGDHNSAIGTGGDIESCDGASPAPPSHDILFDGVTWHDSFWGKTPDEWGGSHPDCLQIDGYVDGVTIRNSVFTRCGDNFLAVYAEIGGPAENVTIERNLFLDGSTYGYFGVQLTDEGKPYRCSGIVFKNNIYHPNSPNAGYPYSPIRTQCSGKVPTKVVGNDFQVGPNSYACGVWMAPPYNTVWANNVFELGDPCPVPRRTRKF
jgi:hypothetical protein